MESLESRLALSHAPLAIEDFGVFSVEPSMPAPDGRNQAQYAPALHNDAAQVWDSGLARAPMPGSTFASELRHDSAPGLSAPAMAFASLRDAPNFSPVVVVLVVQQVYVPAPTIEVSASPLVVIERAGAAARNDASAGPAASAHLALPAVNAAQRTAEIPILRAELASQANNAPVVAGVDLANGPGPDATVVNAHPQAANVPSSGAMLLTPGSTSNIERAGGLSSDGAQPPAVAKAQETLQPAAPTQQGAPIVSSTATDAKVVTVQPNQIIERGPLLATVQVEIESFERALDAALGEIGEMGQDFVGWVEDNINWNSAAAATVAASAGGAYAVRRRMRRAAEQEDEELSSTWLFTSFQTPLGHS